MRYAKHVIFSTDDVAVPVMITYPSPLGAHEIQDLEEFLAIWIRSLKRCSPSTEPPSVPTVW